MRKLMIAAGVLALGAMAPAIASAESAADFNLFVLHDMTYVGSDTEGRVAVGGNANLQNYSVGALASPGDVNFVVGGNFVGNSGSVTGQALIGGTASLTSWSNVGVQAGVSPLPVDFAAEETRLIALSDALHTAETGNTSSICYGAPGTNSCQVTLNSVVAGLNVFNIGGDLLVDTNTFNINLAPGSTALINVSGTNVHMSGGLFVNGVNGGGDPSLILWNFYDATSLYFAGIDVRGSVLAPTADYIGGGGVINGQLIVKSFIGNDRIGKTQVNNHYFQGDLLHPQQMGVPEPATWALMIGGFGLVGASLRRRRAPATA